MGGKQSFNRYNWCSFCTYSLVVYGLVSLFLGHKITACYIVLILFCLSLYIMSISKYDHCYFEYFESIRDINIKNGVINA